ncbi:MAG: response regulator [Ferrovibrio sp.]|uniref:response regulator n=1 Tax=Ferrovibrio sp. TaxID=1917215 RepID=UPI002617A00B|nr:response regulator [Ferrovibrio sp.]MCW0236063.1 response regulator [Ferrovibrio sp.]
MPHKILVADDATAGRAVFEKLLTALGYEPVFARDGRDAINLFIEFPDIAAILMDIRMPGLNGIKATQEIRMACGPRGMKVPIIAITAADGVEVRRECLSSGMNEVLVKPIDPRKLVETIRRFLN